MIRDSRARNSERYTRGRARTNLRAYFVYGCRYGQLRDEYRRILAVINTTGQVYPPVLGQMYCRRFSATERTRVLAVTSAKSISILCTGTRWSFGLRHVLTARLCSLFRCATEVHRKYVRKREKQYRCACSCSQHCVLVVLLRLAKNYLILR